jgi:hypothetical protein
MKSWLDCYQTAADKISGKKERKCERKSHQNLRSYIERMERIGDKLINKRVPHRKEKWRIQ